ncbi:MAG: hypothetical protein ACE5F2_02965 [Candidatus Paceibacteria bacterium]
MKNHSASNFGKDFGVVHEAVVTGRKVGADEKFWAKLAHDDNLFSQVMKVAEGLAEINIVKHIIDGDADPFIPDSWSVEKRGHKKCGQIEFSPERFEFYLSEGQQNGKCIGGNKLRKELKDKPVLNANVMDYLLKNPQLIPEDWKKDENGNTRYIFFWGTIYRSSVGDLYVRYLYWVGGRWYWDGYWLGLDWDGDYPALLLAS